MTVPTKTAPPSAGSRSFLESNAVTFAAVGGYLIAFGVALLGFSIVNADRNAGAMTRYGESMAEDLAHLALNPLLRGDRIQLGLLTNRHAARPEVRRIAIHTVDERLFVVAGDAASATAPTYIRPITVQDTVAGDVSVTLNAEIFALPFSRIFAESWEFALAGLAFTVFVFHFGRHLRSGGLFADGDARPAPNAPKKAFVMVADLTVQSASESFEREVLLAQGMAVARKVANLYAGHAAELPGSGIVLVFPVYGSSDRCFEVVCAALLARRLLASVQGAVVDFEPGASTNEVVAEDPSDAFRYGVDFREAGVAVHDDTVKASAVADVLLLASLAGSGELVLGKAAYLALNRPERIQLEELENPATEALSFGVAMPQGKVRGIDSEYHSLLERQREVITKA